MTRDVQNKPGGSDSQCAGHATREVLFIDRGNGRLELPKGRLEKGESSSIAAWRELREEAGLVLPGPPDDASPAMTMRYDFWDWRLKVQTPKTVDLFEYHLGTDYVTWVPRERRTVAVKWVAVSALRGNGIVNVDRTLLNAIRYILSPARRGTSTRTRSHSSVE